MVSKSKDSKTPSTQLQIAAPLPPDVRAFKADYDAYLKAYDSYVHKVEDIRRGLAAAKRLEKTKRQNEKKAQSSLGSLETVVVVEVVFPPGAEEGDVTESVQLRSTLGETGIVANAVDALLEENKQLNQKLKAASSLKAAAAGADTKRPSNAGGHPKKSAKGKARKTPAATPEKVAADAVALAKASKAAAQVGLEVRGNAGSGYKLSRTGQSAGKTRPGAPQEGSLREAALRSSYLKKVFGARYAPHMAFWGDADVKSYADVVKQSV